MFLDKDEYLNSKNNEREELVTSDFSTSKKIKGILLCGMMVASMSLVGCGNEAEFMSPQEIMVQNTQEQQVSNEKEYETYLFFDGISKEPKELQVIDVMIRDTNYVYKTTDNYEYVFSGQGCVLYKDDGDLWTTNERLAIFTGAAIVKVDLEEYFDYSKNPLNYEENVNESNFEINS